MTESAFGITLDPKPITQKGGINLAQDKLNLAKLPKFVQKEMRKKAYVKWGHGWPHVVRVWKNLQLLLKLCPLDAELIKMLKVAVLFCDIRRDQLVGHAAASASFFRELTIEGLSSEECDTIHYAIQHHSRGLGMLTGKAVEKKDVLLGLLCLLDHMDALGLMDVLRTIEMEKDMEKRMDVFGKIPADKLRRIFEKGELVTRVGEEDLAEESYLTHVLYDYLMVRAMTERVQDQLSEKFLAVTGEEEARQLVEHMLAIKEENEGSLETEAIVF